jgi:hypothetical protein
MFYRQRSTRSGQAWRTIEPCTAQRTHLARPTIVRLAKQGLNGPEEQNLVGRFRPKLILGKSLPWKRRKIAEGLATLPRRTAQLHPLLPPQSPLLSSRRVSSPSRRTANQKNPSKNPGSLRLPRHAAPPPPALAGEGGASRRRRGRCGGVAHQRRLRRRRLPLPPPVRAVESGRRGQFGGHSVRPRPRDPGAHGSRAAGYQQLAARQAGKMLALLPCLTGAAPS